MSDHKLMPEHGQAFAVEIKKANEWAKAVMQAQQQASLDLGTFLTVARNDTICVSFPCKQCIRDIALQFRDLAGMIEELVAEKKCSND